MLRVVTDDDASAQAWSSLDEIVLEGARRMLAAALQVTALTILLAIVSAFLAALAVSRFRFRGRLTFLVTILIVQMVPAEALMISLVKVLDGWDLRNSIIGLTMTYVAFVLPFTVWTLRASSTGCPASWRTRRGSTGRAGCGPS
jgi:N,N'-diacetylchitobiose transport system permease protein